jgi:hypothetical protein
MQGAAGPELSRKIPAVDVHARRRLAAIVVRAVLDTRFAR